MSILKKDYELSVWEDVQVKSDSTVTNSEKRIAIIGGSSMVSNFRAFNPTLTRKANGEINFSFSLYDMCQDPITLQYMKNPYIELITNETKLKLRCEDKWYDLIIKTASESPVNNIYDYTAVDANIHELSKNGFNLEFNNSLGNNMGTPEELGNKILAETDWDLGECDVPVQVLEEALVRLKVVDNPKVDDKPLKIYQIKMSNTNSGVEEDDRTEINLSVGTIIYAFYSCCKDKPYRFQFIYKAKAEGQTEGAQYTIDDDRIVIDKDCQYYIDGCTEDTYSVKMESYGLVVPNGFLFDTVEDAELIPSNMRGKRYVFGQKSKYSDVLQKTLWEYKTTTTEGTTTKYWGYIDTEYIGPSLVSDWAGNNDFTSTAGWSPACYYNGDVNAFEGNASDYRGTCIVSSQGEQLNDLISSGAAAMQYTIPYLEYKTASPTNPNGNITECLVSTGVNDNKANIGSFVVGDQYVLLTRGVNGSANIERPTVYVADYTYNQMKNMYSYDKSKIYLTFSEWHNIKLPAYEINSDSCELQLNEESDYYYSIATIGAGAGLTKENMNTARLKFFLVPQTSADSHGKKTIKLFDFKFFKYVPVSADSSVPITPLSENIQTKELKTCYFYNQDDFDEITYDNVENALPTYKLDISEATDFIPSFYENAAKVRSITAKESNYFNLLQTVAETFEQWLVFDIERNSNGGITSKKVSFKNELGSYNPLGFRYGVNLKQIKRDVDSKNIVTKMIVKNNNNSLAKDSVCSITRAGANETGENYLYDFSYYINHRLIDIDVLNSVLYDSESGQGQDMNLVSYQEGDVVPEYSETATWNCCGYNYRLKRLNNFISRDEDIAHSLKRQITELEGIIYKNEILMEECQERCSNILVDFESAAGFAFPLTSGLSTEQQDIVNKTYSLQGYLREWAEYQGQYVGAYAAYNKAYRELNGEDVVNETTEDETEDTTSTTNNGYKQRHEDIQKNIDNLIDYKRRLNLEFYKLYSRYICEGTWQDQKYSDDELYYIDAQSTMYNSCFPKITYTIEVADIGQIPGYENYKYELGDKSYVEDTEFFGYAADGTPYREEVVLTEMVDKLDNSTQNVIKIQNHKTQFQDLFQRITATVQQTKYAEGSYEKAAELVVGEQAAKSQFLTQALNDAELHLQLMGDPSIDWGKEGLTITDITNPRKALRLTNGAILLRHTSEDGTQIWKSALTANGISTDLLTAGKINTGEITLYDRSHPTFQWNSLGLTAYYYTNSDMGVSSMVHNKGVRFDRFGLYGFHSESETAFKIEDDAGPDAVLDNENVTFALTWEGFKTQAVIQGNTYELNFGKNSKLLSILKKENNGAEDSQILGFDNAGNLSITGKITATSGHIGGTNGWSIGNSMITIASKDLGQQGSFNMYAQGLSTTNASESNPLFGQTANKTWSLGIGENFGVTINGELYCTSGNFTGTINATSGSFTGTINANEGTIGGANGWHITTNTLSSKTIGDNKGICLSTDTFQAKIADISTQDDLMLLIGKKFGVGEDGTLYCSEIQQQGWILSSGNIESTLGNIALINDDSNQSIESLVSPGQTSAVRFNIGGNSTIHRDINGRFSYSEVDQNVYTTQLKANASLELGAEDWGVGYRAKYTVVSEYQLSGQLMVPIQLKYNTTNKKFAGTVTCTLEPAAGWIIDYFDLLECFYSTSTDNIYLYFGRNYSAGIGYHGSLSYTKTNNQYNITCTIQDSSANSKLQNMFMNNVPEISARLGVTLKRTSKWPVANYTKDTFKHSSYEYLVQPFKTKQLQNGSWNYDSDNWYYGGDRLLSSGTLAPFTELSNSKVRFEMDITRPIMYNLNHGFSVLEDGSTYSQHLQVNKLLNLSNQATLSVNGLLQLSNQATLSVDDKEGLDGYILYKGLNGEEYELQFHKGIITYSDKRITYPE